IRSDNGTEFKNSIINQFCEMKGIKREFSVARTPQQNGVAERRNRTLIEAARTMILVIKPHTKTPYELIRGRTPLIDFMKPFGCPVTILNTRDHLGKFDGKADEGFFVGYSMLFDVDSLTISMNYVLVVARNQTNGIAGTRDNIVAGSKDSDEDLMYKTGVYDYPEGFTGPSVSITTDEPVTTDGEGVSTAKAIPEAVSTVEPDMDVTLAEALVDLLKSGKKKSPKPKARGISFQHPEEVARREVISPPVSKISAKDKGKAIMTEPEKPSKKKDQIQIDEELGLRLHAEEQPEFERLQKEREAQEEASRAAIYEEIDNTQAMIKADEQLGARVQAEKQELYSIEEKSRLLVEMIVERKKIHKLFNKTYKHVNSFIPMESDDKDKDSEKKAGGSRKKTLARKRAGEKQSEESAKRPKMEYDAEKEELRAHLDIIPGDDVAVSVESLATKYPIVDWKTLVLSEDKIYYEIIRANGSTKSYKIFTKMVDDFDRQDVLDLYSKDDEVWKAQQDYTLISWRLFDSCGIHVLLMDTGIAIHMLVEKTYPLTQEMLSRMLSGKLEVDNESEMAFELLRFTRSQIEK
ncbi:putative ribonuclease H-like domain-containing protein, partial [Tanacetum coccineum]